MLAHDQPQSNQPDQHFTPPQANSLTQTSALRRKRAQKTKRNPKKVKNQKKKKSKNQKFNNFKREIEGKRDPYTSHTALQQPHILCSFLSTGIHSAYWCWIE